MPKNTVERPGTASGKAPSKPPVATPVNKDVKPGKVVEKVEKKAAPPVDNKGAKRGK